jgi:phenylacetate-CoA ligase
VELAPGREATPELAAEVAEAVHRHIRVTAEVALLPARALPRTAGKTRRVIRKEAP